MSAQHAEKLAIQTRPLPTADREFSVRIKDVRVSRRSRFIIWLMRVFLKPMLAWTARGSNERIARVQLFLASRVARHSCGLPLDFRVVGRVPGHVVGDLADTNKPVVLYIHGGAFIIPATPETYVPMLARWCRELDANGFMVDYRLAPFHKFPAALDDCERAYRALLDLGYSADRIVLAGESAGGNLTLGLLQRIRRTGLPMPACAIPISPATELGHIHAPPSRALKRRQDPLLPIAALERVAHLYIGEADTSDPELSPLYMDCRGLPPIYLLASDNEVLLDDTVLLARRLREVGNEMKLDIWPLFPHAFPLFEQVFPEVRQARKDIIEFTRGHLSQ